MDFANTRYARDFFGHQLPNLIHALSDIAGALKKKNSPVQLNVDVAPDVLGKLYRGEFDPCDVPRNTASREKSAEITAYEDSLREKVTPELWAEIERYGDLIVEKGFLDREQAFASGFRYATTMFAAGLSTPKSRE